MELTKEVLIDYAKSYLKEQGFKKKGNRWVKTSGDFTLVFYVQGSQFSKADYYIRPAIIINALMPDSLSNCHGVAFPAALRQESPEQVMEDFETFCREWTDKALIKTRCEAFIEWDRRNPLEKRRAGLVDYISDPVPSRKFFQLSSNTLQYILDNF